MRATTIGLGLVLLGVGAAVHGSAIHRWEGFGAPEGRADRFHTLRVKIGDFEGESIPNDMTPYERSTATSTRYHSPSRGMAAAVSIITGPAGAVSTHTPDVCYPSSGYRTVKAPTRETIDLPGGGTARYYTAVFEKKTATSLERQRVRWSWTTDGTWVAPDRPRFAFLRAPELFKLYIVTPVADGEGDTLVEDPPAMKQFVAAAFAQYAELFASR